MKHFASSGSCSKEELRIKGKVSGTKFISKEFSGDLVDRDFWERLSKFAEKIDKFVELIY